MFVSSNCRQVVRCKNNIFVVLLLEFYAAIKCRMSVLRRCVVVRELREFIFARIMLNTGNCAHKAAKIMCGEALLERTVRNFGGGAWAAYGV